MNRFLREPLLRFILLGSLIFVLYGLLSRPDASADRRIVVSPGRIENLALLFERTWQRAPTEEELQGLIDAHVREEVLCREGTALGLDRDDLVIRQRIQQKMEFLCADATALDEPTEGDLQAFLDAHAAQFAIASHTTFRQVFLDPLRHSPDLDAAIRQLGSQLKALDHPSLAEDLGDTTMLPARFEGLSEDDAARTFGAEFAASLATLLEAQWAGPLRSGFGLHFVWVEERTDARTPTLAEIRGRVRVEWEHAQRLAANAAFYEGLARKYQVTIEALPGGEEAVLAGAKR